MSFYFTGLFMQVFVYVSNMNSTQTLLFRNVTVMSATDNNASHLNVAVRGTIVGI